MEIKILALNLALAPKPSPGPGPGQEGHRLVRKADERPFFNVGDQGMTKELLSPQGDHDIQMMIIALPAGASSTEVLIGEGEKAGLVLSGTVVIEVAGHRSELSEGDSFQFRSTLPHSVHNETRGPRAPALDNEHQAPQYILIEWRIVQMPPNAPIRLRPLEIQDLAGAHALSQAVNWAAPARGLAHIVQCWARRRGG